MTFKTLIGAVALALATQTVSAQDILPLNGIAMEINSSIVTYSDIQREVNVLKSASANQGVSEAELYQAARRQLFEKSLLADAAREQGLKASSSEVDAEIRRRAQLEHLDEKALYERAAQLGWNRQQYRLSIAKDLVLERLIAQIDERVQISNADVAAYIDQTKREGKPLPQSEPYTIYTIRRIVIGIDENNPSETAGHQAKLIAESIAHGSEFAAMAKRYSQDTAAQEGGLTHSTGFYEPVQVEAALKNLEIGQISVPLQTSKNWQIIQLVDQKIENDPAKLQDEAIRRYLTQQARQQAHAQFVGQLQQNAVVREF